jgi:formylglycine-generating enzyme required for sulfatase activity
MNPRPFILTILLMVCMLVSGCGSPATPAATLPPAPATAAPAPATALPAATATTPPTAPPAESNAPAPTNTVVAPPPSSGAEKVSDKDGMKMLFVPAGDFSMGSLVGQSDETPVHTVTLDAFWIDQTEVTNSMYTKCVQAGACEVQATTGSNTHANYFTAPKFVDYPVVDLKWVNADKYCSWAGRRLPTEAEWERAALGTEGFTYPWGNTNPTSALLNFNTPAGDTVKVGSYPKGASPYGALDMAGNLREWVADWYDAKYYAASPKSNPTGPTEGKFRVVRGGSWHSDVYSVRSADRQYLDPGSRDVTVGFRCAANP